MSKKKRIMDKDCFSLSKNSVKIQDKSTKKVNIHHGFTEKSRKMVTTIFIKLILNLFYCLLL